MFWMEFISWLSAVANVTRTYQVDWIFRKLRFEISLWHCKKNSYRLKLRYKNHLSLQLSSELREASLARRLTNAARVLAMPWSAAKVKWLLFDGRENSGAEIMHGENPSLYRKEPITAHFPPGEFATRSCFIRCHDQYCWSHQQERCRQRRFARTNSPGGKRALYEISSASSKNIPGLIHSQAKNI